MIETNRIEFKRQLTRDLDIEKEVVAFLNYREGGIIYVGIDDNGKPVENPNIDDDMLALKKRILQAYPKRIYIFMDNFIRLTIPFYSQKGSNIAQANSTSSHKNSTRKDTCNDTRKDTRSKVQILLDYCAVPQSLEEMMAILRLKNRPSFTRTYIKPLLAQGLLEMTIPDQPKNKNQKYVSKKK